MHVGDNVHVYVFESAFAFVMKKLTMTMKVIVDEDTMDTEIENAYASDQVIVRTRLEPDEIEM